VSAPQPGVYVDASPLIALALIGRLGLLQTLAQPVWVTNAVWHEVAGDPGWPGAQAIMQAEAQGVLERVDAGNREAYVQLGEGENTVLTAAAEVGAYVVVDDLAARAVIAKDPYLRTAIYYSFTTTSLLLYAKRCGAISAVKPLLDALIQQNYGIDAKAYQSALRLAGEDDPG
jgi:predicted nucleic acid-binding protein